MNTINVAGGACVSTEGGRAMSSGFGFNTGRDGASAVEICEAEARSIQTGQAVSL